MAATAEIARSNGAKSIGPITEEGKAISAQNSLKHGLNSSRVVLPNESQDEYDDLKSSFFDCLRPAGDMEDELVIEMVNSRWRLRRIELMEVALLKKAQREQQELLGPGAEPDDIRDAAFIQVAESKTMRTLVRNQNQLRRAYEKAWNELKFVQQSRREQQEQNEPGVPRSGNRITPRMIETFFNAPIPIAYSAMPADAEPMRS
jgi:hypothetical protein